MTKLRLAILLGLSFCISACMSKDESFLHFFGFAPTRDVKNLHFRGDEIGIDASYWLAFECDDTTVEKIVDTLHLTREPELTVGLSGGLNTAPEVWWDTAVIYKIKPYSRQQDPQRWYLWHDSIKKKVYFLSFDL